MRRSRAGLSRRHSVPLTEMLATSGTATPHFILATQSSKASKSSKRSSRQFPGSHHRSTLLSGPDATNGLRQVVPESDISEKRNLRQLIQQALCHHQIAGFESFGEPIVDGCQQLACLLGTTLLMLQP